MDEFKIKQAASMTASYGCARSALAEVAKLAGIAKLDELEVEFIRRGKNTTVEGIPLELEVECLEIIEATVKGIFAAARLKARE